MKRMILPAILAFGLSGSLALAQQTAPPPPPDASPAAPMHHHRANPQHEAARVAKALNLTPDQQSKLEPIFASRDQQVAALMSQQIGPDDRAHQRHAITKDTDRQLAEVLTADQMQQYKTMRKEHRHKGMPGEEAPEPGASQPAPPPPTA